MSFTVKEIFYTLQGEGANAGRPAVFCRFTGCNLWSGREEDRATALCNFCDTNFVGTDGLGGGKFASAYDLAEAIASFWPSASACPQARPLVVCTGGEPLLQMTAEFVDALHAKGFEVALETNGTRLPPPGIDWITVSPKAGVDLVLTEGDELKLIFPQPGQDPAAFENLQFAHFYLQPMDNAERIANAQRAVQYCLEHPRWRLSLQMQKYLGIR